MLGTEKERLGKDTVTVSPDPNTLAVAKVAVQLALALIGPLSAIPINCNSFLRFSGDSTEAKKLSLANISALRDKTPARYANISTNIIPKSDSTKLLYSKGYIAFM